MCGSDPYLVVNSVELLQGLRRMGKVARRIHKSQALLSFANAELSVEIAGGSSGVSVSVPASGHWPGEVRVDGGSFLAVLRGIRGPGSLELAVRDQRLHIANYTLPCIWEDYDSDLPKLPMNPSLTMILGLGVRYTEAEITQAGLAKVLGQAEGRRDRLIRQAAWLLEPVGVLPADIRRLVDECIARVDA